MLQQVYYIKRSELQSVSIKISNALQEFEYWTHAGTQNTIAIKRYELEAHADYKPLLDYLDTIGAWNHGKVVVGP